MAPQTEYAAALQALPMVSPECLFRRDTIVVIAPHPDDESLGCGGLLAWAAQTGRATHVVFLTDGEASHPGSPTFPPKRIARTRVLEARAAAKTLGVSPQCVEFFHLADGGLADLDPSAFLRTSERLRRLVAKVRPCVVCVTASTDQHGDHQAAYVLARAAISSLPGCRLMSYPIWSWLSAVQDKTPKGFRVHFASTDSQKREAIAAHVSQHGSLIQDSTDPFALPPDLLNFVTQGFEVFLDV